MAQFPKYDFNNPALDYDQVNNTNNDMYSYLMSQQGCCTSIPADEVLSESDRLMQAISIDNANGNTDRYKAGVKSAYLLLYNFVS